MLKFLGLVVLLALTFGAGFYVGRYSIGELTKTVAATVTDLSKNVAETTAGFERSLRERHGLVDAKSEIIQAKSEVLDRNFGTAAKALADARESLEQAREMEKFAERAARINALIGKIRPIERELAMGRTVARARLDEIQKEVDALAAR